MAVPIQDEVDIHFPIGYHEFHEDVHMNFQLNRWHSFGYLRKDDILLLATRIHNLEDWKHELVRFAYMLI